MSNRDTRLAQLGAVPFDVLIVGGGIVGAGIARDATLRGLRVALIEQGDFASGTSSKTSKLIHGGLRYLEHGHLRLVIESLRERHRLRTIAPSLVHPLSLLLPIYQHSARAPWKIRLGLQLYDWLAAGRALQPSRMLTPSKTVALEPALRRDGLRAAGLFADCQMDDARLCLANILQSISLGAVCVNYTRLRAFIKADWRVCGGVIEDIWTGRTIEVQARAVINATGPWADRLRRLSDRQSAARLAPIKGIHVLVPRVAHHGLFVQHRMDGRMLFILPFGDLSLIGTTETEVRGPLETLRAEADEVEYLLDGVNPILPAGHLSPQDIIATYAGARPLLGVGRTATSASREHRIEADRAGLLSVMGGKFTTYRLIAQQAVDAAVALHRLRADRCLSAQVSLLEDPQPMLLEHWSAASRQLGPERLAGLLMQYGSGTLSILKLISRDPALAEPVCPHHETLQAELVHAMQEELACTLTDLLARRTRIAWSPCHGLDALCRVVDLFRQYGQNGHAPLQRQEADYRLFLAQTMTFRHAVDEPHPVPS